MKTSGEVLLRARELIGLAGSNHLEEARTNLRAYGSARIDPAAAGSSRTCRVGRGRNTGDVEVLDVRVQDRGRRRGMAQQYAARVLPSMRPALAVAPDVATPQARLDGGFPD